MAIWTVLRIHRSSPRNFLPCRRPIIVANARAHKQFRNRVVSIATLDSAVIISAHMNGNGDRTHRATARNMSTSGTIWLLARFATEASARPRSCRDGGGPAAPVRSARAGRPKLMRTKLCRSPKGRRSRSLTSWRQARRHWLSGDERVLEVGAGTGYQAAVALTARPRSDCRSRRFRRWQNQRASGSRGLATQTFAWRKGTVRWDFRAMRRFDAILVSAAAPAVPQPLLDQLAEGGRLVIPVGETRSPAPAENRKVEGNAHQGAELFPCRFVPLVGRFGWR